VWPNKNPTRQKKAAYRPVILGVNAAKGALDCRVYAYGVLCGLIHFGYRLNAQAQCVALDYAEQAGNVPGTHAAPASRGGTAFVSQLA